MSRAIWPSDGQAYRDAMDEAKRQFQEYYHQKDQQRPGATRRKNLEPRVRLTTRISTAEKQLLKQEAARLKVAANDLLNGIIQAALTEPPAFCDAVCDADDKFVVYCLRSVRAQLDQVAGSENRKSRYVRHLVQQYFEVSRAAA